LPAPATGCNIRCIQKLTAQPKHFRAKAKATVVVLEQYFESTALAAWQSHKKPAARTPQLAPQATPETWMRVPGTGARLTFRGWAKFRAMKRVEREAGCRTGSSTRMWFAEESYKEVLARVRSVAVPQALYEDPCPQVKPKSFEN
jgi:hypothetical protein